MDDVGERVREFDRFYDSCSYNGGYLDILTLVGSDSKVFKRVMKKYGIPKVRFRLNLVNNSGDVEGKVGENDKSYFERFRSYVTLFPETSWVLNSDSTVFDFGGNDHEARFWQGFQLEKSYNKECAMYRRLCRAEGIGFGKLELPFDYLWESRKLPVTPVSPYTVNVGEHLRLELDKGRISFA